MSGTVGYTTYPEDRDLLTREIDKLLQDKDRQTNIKLVRKLIESHRPNGRRTKVHKAAKRGR